MYILYTKIQGDPNHQQPPPPLLTFKLLRIVKIAMTHCVKVTLSTDLILKFKKINNALENFLRLKRVQISKHKNGWPRFFSVIRDLIVSFVWITRRSINNMVLKNIFCKRKNQICPKTGRLFTNTGSYCHSYFYNAMTNIYTLFASLLFITRK